MTTTSISTVLSTIIIGAHYYTVVSPFLLSYVPVLWQIHSSYFLTPWFAVEPALTPAMHSPFPVSLC